MSALTILRAASRDVANEREVMEAIDALAELVAAASLRVNVRHTGRMSDSPDGESCGLCGHNWRDLSRHFAAGESAATDAARLAVALTRCGVPA